MCLKLLNQGPKAPALVPFECVCNPTPNDHARIKNQLDAVKSFLLHPKLYFAYMQDFWEELSSR